jgi:hypothetical protein
LLAAPKVVPCSDCAASNRSDFVNFHLVKAQNPI